MLHLFLLVCVASAATVTQPTPLPIPAPKTTDEIEKNAVSLKMTSPGEHTVAREFIQAFSRQDDVILLNRKCNSEELEQILQLSISSSLSTSKMVISERAEREFNSQFDVICAKGIFSYYIEASKYCEVTKNEITCLAYNSTKRDQQNEGSGAEDPNDEDDE
ncbi:unnamed protein product [Caenorhabditis bovis]|uniref:Ground-like domain-containing protein n=1 Tax=Caenorhabditis bovis TaxID=2654633 RepID=A0A8S1E1M3_9PELO|nr:unnamed protein product [Caenorhabditis bovis]